MATNEGSGASASRKPDRIPTSVVFGEPPGIDGVLLVGAEHGDVVIHVRVDDRQFCSLVLTLDHALSLSLGLCAHIIKGAPEAVMKKIIVLMALALPLLWLGWMA